MEEIVVPTITKILIADDHAMFIDGIKSLLRKFDKAEIVAEAHDGQEALAILKEGGIDLLITDINMPGLSGTELTKIVKRDFPEVKVLVLTMYNDREIINEILLAEAEGYILKNTGKQELITAINRLADDGTYYSNEVMNIILENIKDSNKPPKQENDRVKDLTPRELEILQLICEELSTAEISQKLYISPRTVETHRKHIIQKTQVKTIVGLIKLAIENKLV
jgi:DNA-binding NarL/FixJ family response regulator